MKNKKTIIAIIIIIIIIIGSIIFMKNKNNNKPKETIKPITTAATTGVKTLSAKETKNKEVLLKFSKLLTGNSFIGIDFLNSQTLTINTQNPQVIDNHIMLTGYYTTNPNLLNKEYKYNIYAKGNNTFEIIESHNNIQEKTMSITIDAKNKSKYGGYKLKYDSTHKGMFQFGKANAFPFYNGVYNNKKFTIINENYKTGNDNAFTLIYNNKIYSIATPNSLILDLNNLVLYKALPISPNEKPYYKLNIKSLSKDTYEVSFTKNNKIISIKITGSLTSII